ncbi:MAG: TIGR04295 family B12-binding domain-containing radical SAM protein [Rhodospirillaceae bacterium]
MKVSLVNPPWTFEGSIYFGCREPHLPLELGYSAALLTRAGHEAEIIDAPLQGLGRQDVVRRVEAFGPDMTVVTTAPTYLFWRCAQPELRVPRDMLAALKGKAGRLVAVGPHGSATPRAALRKLGADVVVMGECEEIVASLAEGGPLDRVPSIAWRDAYGRGRVQGAPAAAKFSTLPALLWPEDWVARHRHHHHRFDGNPAEWGPGAEVEASRGCPYHCSFCAKENFRDSYRRRDLGELLLEIDTLRGQGAEYLYFIDEIFLPDRRLLEALVGRGLKFGVQTRIDLWKPEMLDLLGHAGCVSIEAGMESLTAEGRDMLAKDCRMDTNTLTQRLVHARRRVPFVQANLIAVPTDDAAHVARWREAMKTLGIWANDPVPLFPYPGTPDYRRLFGPVDDHAWERAVQHYLSLFDRFSDIQDERPLPLAQLEGEAAE